MTPNILQRRALRITAVCLLGLPRVGAASLPELLRQSGVSGGLVIHVGSQEADSTLALCAGEGFLVHGLLSDAARVQSARERALARGMLGRVAFSQWNGGELPFIDNVASLLVVEPGAAVPSAEALRVVRPGGVWATGSGNGWQIRVKPRDDDRDEWTHWLHGADGNAVANDRALGPPRRLQWIAGPLWSQHHDTMPAFSAMVTANGRVFAIVNTVPAGIAGLPDQWQLLARDAFSGVLLWTRPLPDWGWEQWSDTWRGRFNQPPELPKRLVAIGDTVYVTLGFNAPVTALSAATGETLRTYPGTEGTDELLYDGGTLFLAVATEKRKPSAGKSPPVPRRVLAVDAETGQVHWQQGVYVGLQGRAGGGEPFGRLELTVGKEGVFLLDHDALVCLNRHSGQEKWRVPRPVVPEWIGLFRQRMNDQCVLVYHDGVLLFAQPEMEVRDPWHSIPGTLYAHAADSGKLLWRRRYGGWMHFGQPDVFVIDGRVWVYEHAEAKEGVGDGKKQRGHQLDPPQDQLDYGALGLNLRTGEVEQRVSAKQTFAVGHHHRCYRGKATTQFLLPSRRGTEFIDLESGANHPNHWIRGGCLYGILPANGLLYAPPDPCICYLTAKLNGWIAAAGESTRGDDHAGTVAPRLERGPAAAPPPTDGDADWWPTYRHDAQRHGAAAAAMGAQVTRAWLADAGAKLTSCTLADGKAFVADAASGCVTAVSLSTGELTWRFAAGGPVDSPPTLHRGLALFGSRDGYVYCLRASDGGLVWRFRAAPRDRRLVAFERTESVWPVPGSVLVLGDSVFFAAGRSSFLDGGLTLFALDVATGELQQQTQLDTADREDQGGLPYDMPPELPGAQNDILAADSGALFLRHLRFDPEDLNRAATGDLAEDAAKSRRGDPVPGPQVVANAGFLDDSWFNQTYWTYRGTAHSKLLVTDGTQTFGVKPYAGSRRHSRAIFEPGKQGYTLFAWDHEARKQRWSIRVPVRIRALALTGNMLWAAGSPDTIDAHDPWGPLEGRGPGELLAFAAADSKQLAEYPLPAPPVFDGLAAAHGHLVVALSNGQLACYSAG